MALPNTFAPNTKILSALVNANFVYLDNATIALTTVVAGKLTAASNLSDLTNATTARTNLGLGTASTVTVGTSGATVGLLNANKTDSGNNTFSGANTVSGSLAVPTAAPGTSTTQAASTAFVGAAIAAFVVRSYIAGLTLSTAGASVTFGIAAGVAADTTDVSMMVLATAYTKTTSPWAVGSGNGALDVQANVINSSWYHAYLIQRPDTGVVDVLVSQAPGISGPATITIASPGVVTFANHGLQLSAPVVFSTTGALPTGLVAGTIYYVQSVPTVNTFTVSATQGGSVINTSGSQSGVQTLIANPILPANYTRYRRIGSMETNGSGQWFAFSQTGNQFTRGVQVSDISATQGTTSTRYSLASVPSGVQVEALFTFFANNSSAAAGLLISPTSQGAITASTSGGRYTTVMGTVNNGMAAMVRILTDTSQGIQVVSDTAATTFNASTSGWIDNRGNNA